MRAGCGNALGELKTTGTLPSGDYQAVSLKVFTSSPGNCSGSLVAESGLSVP